MTAEQNTQPKNPLHGVTLERMLTELVEYFGWETLAQRIRIRCFANDPSISSCLKFLRKTPWARAEVESLYLFPWVKYPAACCGLSKPSHTGFMNDETKIRYWHKSHNVSVLLYHLVCPAKYRRVVIDSQVDAVLREVCLEISLRYDIAFIEIGTDGDHVHFLVQSVPTYRPQELAQKIKSLTAREVLLRCPQVKKQLWGGAFWSSGYFISTVGQHGNAASIAEYVRNQGSEAYQTLHHQQLVLFET